MRYLDNHVKSQIQPGEWIEVARRTGRALDYESKMSGKPIVTRGGKSFIEKYEVKGVKFDDFNGGKLIDYKHQYGQFINKKTGQFYDWFRGRFKLLDQAIRQTEAADGIPIEWIVQPGQSGAFKYVVGRIDGITIVETN